MFRVDPEPSLVVVEARRGGSLARLGHDHVVASHDVGGYVSPNDGRSDLYVRLDSLIVDEPGLRADAGFDTQPSADDIAGTRQNMLQKVLQADRYPYALINVKGVDAVAGGAGMRVAITLHGITRAMEVPARIETSSDSIDVSGRLALDADRFRDHAVRDPGRRAPGSEPGEPAFPDSCTTHRVGRGSMKCLNRDLILRAVSDRGSHDPFELGNQLSLADRDGKEPYATAGECELSTHCRHTISCPETDREGYRIVFTRISTSRAHCHCIFLDGTQRRTSTHTASRLEMTLLVVPILAATSSCVMPAAVRAATRSATSACNVGPP